MQPLLTEERGGDGGVERHGMQHKHGSRATKEGVFLEGKFLRSIFLSVGGFIGW